ncbi:hypothetical protein NDU88_006024 [Pleurodeles waltl]|uniref:Uncharacterized protein n=1 Tax=Pleurodeles waltl TaxID=8319 RepID=A0AAV7RMR9_PLEWA|nr:hypothetical protein NDU88_006024 [Pleurodeles waltl]
MAPKPIRTPRSSRVHQNPDPLGSKKDKRRLAPCSKEHINPHGKGAQKSIPGMEKDARNWVPTMFANIMKTKQIPPEKAAPDIQPSVAGVDGGQVSAVTTPFELPVFVSSAGGSEVVSTEITGTGPGNSGEVGGSPLFGEEKAPEQELKAGLHELNQGKTNVQPRSLAKDISPQETEDMVKHLAIFKTISPGPAQRGKEVKPAGVNSDQGLIDTAESFFSLSDQSRDSDIDKKVPLTDSDIEGSSAASIWASNHLTCRRKSLEQTGARQKLGTKLRGDPTNPQDEVCEMQWDYTSTQQAFVKVNMAGNTSMPPPMDGPAETPSLDLIHRTMVHNHEQAQKESRKVKLANRQLKLSIKKVVKSCQDIGTRIASMETRTEELETEVRATTAQTVTQGQQISDIQWKLEDAENRQRRNNLRVLGIAESLEGQDTRAYVVSLFKKAFPDLLEWNWEMESQRAHRFPLMRKKQTLDTSKEQCYSRAIIVYFGKFLLQQVVFERTHPNSKMTVEGVSFFTRPDFAHATVERRWRLRQMIAQFQELAAEAYLLSPVRLKVIYKATTRFFLSEIKAGEYGQQLKVCTIFDLSKKRDCHLCLGPNSPSLTSLFLYADLVSSRGRGQDRASVKNFCRWLEFHVRGGSPQILSDFKRALRQAEGSRKPLFSDFVGSVIFQRSENTAARA